MTGPLEAVVALLGGAKIRRFVELEAQSLKRRVEGEKAPA